MASTHTSPTANATGVLDTRFTSPLVHYRGIQYGSIAQRFAAPALVDRDVSQHLTATEFGPRCPQPPVDVRDLMQIPRHLRQNARDREDEFGCLNLIVTTPQNAQQGHDLPVLFWIYGGSQVVSFSTAQHRLGDTGPLAAQAVACGLPVVLVTVNYRLNLFAYGDGEEEGEKNLQLQDLRCALAWVEKNVGAFGGNARDVAVAGESAGAILAHALLLPCPPVCVRRVVCMSGTLHTSPPKPREAMQPVLERVLRRCRQLCGRAEVQLRDVPVPVLVRAMGESALSTVWLQESEELQGWEEHERTFGALDAVLVGDCEFEGVLWSQAANMFSEKGVTAYFAGMVGKVEKVDERNQVLVDAYLKNERVTDRRLGQVKSGALDFIADKHFGYHSWKVKKEVGGKGRTRVWQYVFDEANPWNGKARAHHAVDLLALFGGFDADFPRESRYAEVGERFRDSVIRFVSGMEPWREEMVFAFGPGGKLGELTDEEYSSRRRTEQFKVLDKVGRPVWEAVWTRIAAMADAMIVKKLEMEMRQAMEAAKKRKMSKV